MLKIRVYIINFINTFIMPIQGIDQSKCVKCGLCVLVCPATLYKKEEDGTVRLLTNEFCIKCGHCIAVCPEDAIIRENMEDTEPYPDGKDSGNFVAYENLLNLFRSKRSLRCYKSKKVEKELLEKVFKAIRYAPSGGNSRLWKFAVISDSKMIKSMSDSIIEAVSRVNKQYAKGYKVKKKIGLEPIFFDAPHIIILYYPPNIPGANGHNTAIAITYGMLAAETLGLGTCWIGVAQQVLSADKEFKELAGIRGTISGVITIGYPDVKYRRFTSRPPLKIIGLE
ncbi:MAG: nitroreductase family protein [Promethearchaeota archaeon]